MSDLISREDAVNAIYHHFPQLSMTDAERVLYEVQSIRNDGDTISRQATIDYLIANVPHDDYGDELDADELREMWTERINKIPSTELHLVNGSQGLVKEFNKDYALRSIEQYIDKFDCIDVNFLDGLKTAMQLIRELPSAEPQERKGKWIHREDMDFLDENKVKHIHFMCSECGLIHDFLDWHTAQYNFCPNCGCKMEVEK